MSANNQYPLPHDKTLETCIKACNCRRQANYV